jgi:hypothetical protein
MQSITRYTVIANRHLVLTRELSELLKDPSGTNLTQLDAMVCNVQSSLPAQRVVCQREADAQSKLEITMPFQARKAGSATLDPGLDSRPFDILI